MRLIPFPILFLLFATASAEDKLNLDQKLILACHNADVPRVVDALRKGANVNGSLGAVDGKLLQDKWNFGYAGSPKWTALLALADSSIYPDPPRPINYTTEGLASAREELSKIPKSELERRERDQLTILLILLSHKCDIDACDEKGATALYYAIGDRKEKFARVLLEYGASVNTKTGVYIDGPGDLTPLHHAGWSKELTRLLLERGADPNAKDSTGKTPRDYAKQSGDEELLKVYPPSQTPENK